MKRLLLPSPAFLRAARRLVKKNTSLAEDLRVALELLGEDAFDSRLRTHKLKGKLEHTWACSAGYDLRILFSFVEHEESFFWRRWAATTKCTDFPRPKA